MVVKYSTSNANSYTVIIEKPSELYEPHSKGSKGKKKKKEQRISLTLYNLHNVIWKMR